MTWIWPLAMPQPVARGAWRCAGLAGRLFEGWGWLPAAACAGAVPLAVAFLFGGSWHQPVSACLLFALFIAAVRADRVAKGIGVVAAAYAAHMALAIFLARGWPAQAAACFPGGAEYWAKNLTWLRTGLDPEYEIANWVPAHFQLFGAMAVTGYLTLGFIPFLQGFVEVDLMNYYVGRLIATSDSGSAAVLAGWHLWSVMRGICYALLIYEVASWSLSRMTGRPLSTRRARAIRWAAAIGFFSADCAMKLTLLEPVRLVLQENLS